MTEMEEIEKKKRERERALRIVVYERELVRLTVEACSVLRQEKVGLTSYLYCSTTRKVTESIHF